MKSANKIIAFPKANVRTNADETAFLPAALEIVETPASPAGRAVAATIIAIFCFALAGRLSDKSTSSLQHQARSFHRKAPRSFSPSKSGWSGPSMFATDKR